MGGIRWVIDYKSGAQEAVLAVQVLEMELLRVEVALIEVDLAF